MASLSKWDFIEQDLEIMSAMMRNAGLSSEAAAADDQAATSVETSSKSSKKKRNPPYCRATQTWPRWDLLATGEPGALDFEFQDYIDPVTGERRHRLGRSAMKNTIGEAVLDVYSAYKAEPGVQKRYSPPRFGVEAADLMFENGAVPAEKVERWLEELVANRPIILHGGTHDKTAFYIRKRVLKDRPNVIDTQGLYKKLQGDATPSLALCAEKILNIVVQEDDIHDPTEDASATMQLYLRKFPFDRAAALATAQSSTQTNGGRGGRGDRGGRRGGRGGRGRGRGRVN